MDSTVICEAGEDPFGMLVLISFPMTTSGCMYVPHVSVSVLSQQEGCPNPRQTCIITNYQLPNGPVKAGRRWGQRHPQGANLGSNGILKFLSKTDTMAATSPP